MFFSNYSPGDFARNGKLDDTSLLTGKETHRVLLDLEMGTA